VTVDPIDVGLEPSRLCVAVDPADSHGGWWWQPGQSGCASRSTGPGVFPAEQATSSRAGANGPVAIEFRLGTHSTARPFITVRLVVADDQMRNPASGVHVAIRPRPDLDVPELPGRGRE